MRTRCPNCNCVQDLPDTQEGKVIQCRECEAPLTVAAETGIQPVAGAQAAAPALATPPRKPLLDVTKPGPGRGWHHGSASEGGGSRGAHDEHDVRRVLLDPGVVELRMTAWQLASDSDGATWMTATAENVGNRPVRHIDYAADRFRGDGTRLAGGLLDFPDLNPGESGKVRVFLGDADVAVVHRVR